jgi:hypothetical protein
MQIIVMALATGCVVFAVVAVVLASQDGVAGDQAAGAAEQAPSDFLITYVALGAVLPMLFAFFIVRGFMTNAAQKAVASALEEHKDANRGFAKTDQLLESTALTKTLLAWFQNQLIISAALFEGTAFLSLVAYIIERNPISLVVAMALVVGILLQFPTRASVSAWMERLVESGRNLSQFAR